MGMSVQATEYGEQGSREGRGRHGRGEAGCATAGAPAACTQVRAIARLPAVAVAQLQAPVGAQAAGPRACAQMTSSRRQTPPGRSAGPPRRSRRPSPWGSRRAWHGPQRRSHRSRRAPCAAAAPAAVVARVQVCAAGHLVTAGLRWRGRRWCRGNAVRKCRHRDPKRHLLPPRRPPGRCCAPGPPR